jgi:hypothetical protein
MLLASASMMYWIVRDAALRDHGDLRERFDRGPTEQFGRFDLHWP